MLCQVPRLPGRVVWFLFAFGLLSLQHLASIRLDNADMKSCVPGSSCASGIPPTVALQSHTALRLDMPDLKAPLPHVLQSAQAWHAPRCSAYHMLRCSAAVACGMSSTLGHPVLCSRMTL